MEAICINCKFYESIDYRVNPHGVEDYYGTCNNKECEDYNTEVPERMYCEKAEQK